jgi:hypothetical protein
VSHGRVGAVGNDAALSAQSKHVVGGETDCLWLGRDELRWMGGGQGVGGGPGVFVGIDDIVGDDVRV